MSEAAGLMRAHAVSKTYPDGQVQALRDVTLTVDRGEYLAVMGPSGCGKSTLLNLMGALDRPSAGEIFFEGQRLSALRDLDRFRAAKVGFVFQSFLLLPTLTAAENVQVPMFTGTLGAGRRARKALELLNLVGMAHRAGHRPTRLSVGERQRVAIARALANDPVLLLADEPTGNLDSGTAAGVLDLFDRVHAERGTTLVVVTHGEDVAARARRVVRMRDGRLLSGGEGVSNTN
jgi:putative ABC transport system ATP-binding protein